MEKRIEIRYKHFDSYEELCDTDRQLVEAARCAAKLSRSPYSNFSVGAAVRLVGGEVESAANVESEVYPAGICAERNVLFGVVTRHKEPVVESIAVVSLSTDDECYPCGLCRQTLLDTERRQGAPIRVIMAGGASATIVESAESLLPFSFKL